MPRHGDGRLISRFSLRRGVILALAGTLAASCSASGRVSSARDSGPSSIDGATIDDASTASDARIDASAIDASILDAASSDASTLDATPPVEDASPPPSPVRALVTVHEDDSLAITSLVANTGHTTVYAVDVPARAGDVLRIRGQIEMTNDYLRPVRGAIRLVADDVAIGAFAAQNAIVEGGHHMPLWADALVEVAADATIHIEAQLSAGRSDANPSVMIEDGYGHVVVEQHRLYASRAAAAAEDALLLSSLTRDDSEAITTFGATAFARSTAFEIAPAARAGDHLRVYAQTTSLYTVAGIDMHGHGIHIGDTRIGPWSTENTPFEIQTVPLFSETWHDVGDDGAVPIVVTMHGVNGRGGAVLAGGGHLTALRFVPADRDDTSDDETPRSLDRFADVAGTTGLDAIVANSGWQTVATTPFDAAMGDIVRVTGALSLAHPSGFALGISCVAQIELLAGDVVVATSPYATKYVTASLEVLPLRAELIDVVSSTEPIDSARLVARCSREGASPTVTVLAGTTRLIAEAFVRVPR